MKSENITITDLFVCVGLAGYLVPMLFFFFKNICCNIFPLSNRNFQHRSTLNDKLCSYLLNQVKFDQNSSQIAKAHGKEEYHNTIDMLRWILEMLDNFRNYEREYCFSRATSAISISL